MKKLDVVHIPWDYQVVVLSFSDNYLKVDRIVTLEQDFHFYGGSANVAKEILSKYYGISETKWDSNLKTYAISNNRILIVTSIHEYLDYGINLEGVKKVWEKAFGR